jgi:hypothetical protein
LCADVTGDGYVTLSDVVQVTRHLHSHARRYDVNADGEVTMDDLQIVLAQVGRSC